MEIDVNTVIARVNLYVLPLFVIYMALRSRTVVAMVCRGLTRVQAGLVVGLTLAAVEGIHLATSGSGVALMTTAVMRLGIVLGMVFGSPVGVAFGALGGLLTLAQEQANATVGLTVLVTSALCGLLGGMYRSRVGPVWERRGLALLTATGLLVAALLVTDVVLFQQEATDLARHETIVDARTILGFGLVFFLIQSFVLERVEGSTHDALAGEMGFARRMQMDLVAHTTEGRADERADVAGLLHPAKDVGGDWYDWWKPSENTLCLVIGDVSGKGVPASLFMVVGCMLFRAFKDDAAHASPADLLEWVNDDLCEDNKSKMFITAVCAVLDLETGALVYSNVGHTTAYIRRRSGELVPLPVTTKGALGFFKHKKFASASLHMDPQDLFLAYTDGVTEARNPAEEMFGRERLERVLAAYHGSAQGACETIAASVRQFAAGNAQSDDITVLAVQFGG